MEYFLRCSWCKSLTSTGRLIRVLPEMSANPSPVYDYASMPESELMWCCTACYTVHLSEFVEKSKDAPRHLNG